MQYSAFQLKYASIIHIFLTFSYKYNQNIKHFENTPLVLADFFHQNASQSYLKTTNETVLVDYRFSDATHTSIKTKNAKAIDAKIFNENFDKTKKS